MALYNGNTKSTILVVDDTPDNLSLIGEILKDTYTVKIAISGEKALRIASSEHMPDLILLDVMMPGMDGYEVCKLLKDKEQTRDIPIIFLTTRNDDADEQYGLAIGAVDYIAKPVNIPILMARISTHLRLKEAADFMKDKNAFLEREVERRTEQLHQIQDVTISTLAALAESRDSDTGYHITRTQHYVRILAEKLKEHPKFKEPLSEGYINTLFKSAPLHDIGKVGIPDQILLKPGKLDVDEFEIMKTHTVIGHDAIQNTENKLNINVDFLHCAKEIALNHHEKWNGTGYPRGLSGDAIPVSARIMAVADVYDALISKRVYKNAMTHDEALAILLKDSGTHFDPEMIEALLQVTADFERIATKYKDASAPAG